MQTDDLYTFLFAWVRKVSCITAIRANQDAPRPPFPYATIWVPLAGLRIGGVDEIRYNQVAERYEQHAFRAATVSLNIFGTNANSKMSELLDSLDWPSVAEEFSEFGIAVVGEVGPNDLTYFEDTKTVERSQLDLSLNYRQVRVAKEPDEDCGAFPDAEPIEEVVITHEDTPTGDVEIIASIKE